MTILDAITQLSHQFGTDDYVKGGGGNTSCKDATILWAKPSGTTLAHMTPESFVAIDRAKIALLFDAATPDDPAAREVLVKDIMAAAVLPDSAGRPSVEAPLHDSFASTFVVHTHPPIINGLTCSVDAAAVCGELFPDALWMDYIDPGYTLCMAVREAIAAYRAAHRREPAAVILKNHGVFIAGDTPDAVRATYSSIMSKIESRYAAAGIDTALPIAADPDESTIAAMTAKIQAAVATPDAAAVAAGGMFDYTDGPVTPDHIVYAKAYPLTYDPTTASIAAYTDTHGYPPRVIVAGDAIYGLGTSPTRARLALQLAQDGALVKQLASAFGGLNYMTRRALEFIDNWEVESYRQKQISDS